MGGWRGGGGVTTPLWDFDFEILFLGVIKTFLEPNIDCCNSFGFLKGRCYTWIKFLWACLDLLTFVGIELFHSYDLSFVEGRRETISFGFFWRCGPSIFPLPSAHCGDCRDAIKGGRWHNHQGCIKLPLQFYGLCQECYMWWVCPCLQASYIGTYASLHWSSHIFPTSKEI